MSVKLELNKEEIKQFIREVDMVRACMGKACLEEAIRGYVEKAGLPSDEFTIFRLKSIYENHKASQQD